MVPNQRPFDVSRCIAITLILMCFVRSELMCPDKFEGTQCQPERKDFNITFHDCEPINLFLNVCRGLCDTSELTDQVPPFIKKHCTCCEPTKYSRHRIRRRTMCSTPTELKKRVRKTIFYMKIYECGCLKC